MATLSLGSSDAIDRNNATTSSNSSSANHGNSFGVRYGKYRGILMSVALFILLDASVMILNFYVSFEIADDAVGINLAGRQRMLSQRMAKTLYSLKSELPNSPEYLASVKELKNSESLFDETLTAFSQGGSTHSAGKNWVILPKVKSMDGQQFLTEAAEIWLPY